MSINSCITYSQIARQLADRYHSLSFRMVRFVGVGGGGLTDGLVEEEGFADVFDFGDCAF